MLLVVVFTLVFAVFVNHDLLVTYGPDRIWIKDRATSSEIVVESVVAGLVLSTMTVLAHTLVESVVGGLSSARPPSAEHRRCEFGRGAELNQ
jgi:hypothetical protein